MAKYLLMDSIKYSSCYECVSFASANRSLATRVPSGNVHRLSIVYRFRSNSHPLVVPVLIPSLFISVKRYGNDK